jgi:hypothetical protein
MRSALILCGCALLLVWIAYRHLRDAELERLHTEALRENAARTMRARHARFLADLMPASPKPRIEESNMGVFVRASCPEEAAEILYLRYCSPVRAA